METTTQKSISFDEFYQKYGVRRNPILASSSYKNTLIEFDDLGEEIIEDEDPKNVWTLMQIDGIREALSLRPGIYYNKDVIGFFICKQKWTNEKEHILE